MGSRTVNQPIVGQPLLAYEGGDGSFPKPGELIEIRGGEALTQYDRTVFNLLIVNAWETITEKKEHVIAKRLLRGNHDSTDRINETIDRLRSVQIEMRQTRDGKPGWYRDYILGPRFTHDDPDGNLYYRFTDTVIEIITKSDHWGRLQAQVMLAMTSKYSQALYEIVQKRAGLRGRFTETFELEALRAALGVPKGKMERWQDFRRFCLEPAVAEVDALSSCHVQVSPVKKGRAITHVELRWFPKEEDALKEAAAEVKRHKVGRKARIAKKVDAVQLDLLGDEKKT
ncbi:replication initiation protein [Azospirillum sp. Sh1]|uniref:replication initiation protein n=1 Tax=Azospirillum sp. Sh1 TaxID=2607285 RepID=UPI00165E5F5C|nr:replication initiation protein [Azospirillum sp. Sh1]